MKNTWMIFGVTTLLVGAILGGLAVSVAPKLVLGAGADEHALHGGMAGDDPHAQLGMQRPAFPQATGSVPTQSQAEQMPQVDRIVVRDEKGFTPSNGFKSGTGTLEDPYVISGLYVTGDLYLADTESCIVIKENWIGGQLTLNWNNQCVHVHHNHIRDLRVNENIERTGMPSGGLIELNEIVIVGQIRHYDGEFRNNVVGPASTDDLWDKIFHESPLPFVRFDPVVLNIDGWNQALFHHNTIYGSVSLDLHGHHHGTGFLAPHSHYHGDGPAPEHAEDHTMRWSSVSFTDNKVVDPTGYGIRYDDQAHAGDDRTANSESVEMLDKPHRHFVEVDISRNIVEGAGIWVDVFGADDERHKATNPGTVTVTDNQVKMVERDNDMLGTPFFSTGWDANQAIRIVASKEVAFTVTGNVVSFKASGQSNPLDPVNNLLFGWYSDERVPVGIEIYDARNASFVLSDNEISGFQYGIRARYMDDASTWQVENNRIDAREPVWYDETVANKPGGEPAEPQSNEPHNHTSPRLRI